MFRSALVALRRLSLRAHRIRIYRLVASGVLLLSGILFGAGLFGSDSFLSVGTRSAVPSAFMNERVSKDARFLAERIYPCS
jgi:hypothetical protein